MNDIKYIRIKIKKSKRNLYPKTFDFRDNWDRILYNIDKYKGDCDTMVSQAVIEGFVLGYQKGLQDKRMEYED